MVATSLETELAEQVRWRLRPEWAPLDWTRELNEGEFLAPGQQHAAQAAALRETLRFAADHVPHYRTWFKQAGLSAEDIRTPEDLSALPVLTRADLMDNPRDFISNYLPAVQGGTFTVSTSGSTGQPLKVIQTEFSDRLWRIMAQRQMRWFRFDPSATFAAIRPLQNLCRGTDCPKDKTYCFPAWPSVGRFFETGPYVGYAFTNSQEKQLEWVENQQPDYLMTYSATLEYLAFGYQVRRPPGSLRGLHAIGQQLTPKMRSRIEHTFRLKVFQNYGLNEFGIVASRCPEGDRYHVHAEHCLVEIINEEGRLCRPGEIARLLVSTLSNAAMPLIRYDTGDLAEAVDGPCPCGRTLPSFADVHGRYRRIAYLPPGSWGYRMAINTTIIDMPKELTVPLKRCQLHQYRDGSFELRLETATGVSPEFKNRIMETWNNVDTSEKKPPLNIVEMEEIPRGTARKFEDFTSDFYPAQDISPTSRETGG